ncbi:MAG: hypothetical protein IKK04_09010 [Bacteroidales bacterium]|nr:hypothetical protein [Bacteroidales bacterium]
MNKFFIAFTFAAAFLCSTAMAQQPQQRPEQKDQPCQEKMDKPCHNHAHQNCPHHAEKGQTECMHQNHQGQQPCSHQGEPGHQCSHQGEAGHQCNHQCDHNPAAFRPHGQAIVTLFEHFGATNTQGAWTQNGFQLERAYLGYKYMFDPHWTATIIFDASEASFTNGIEHVFVKNAFVQYKQKGLTATAGIIPTSHAWLSEKYWGLRYVARSMFDLYGFGNVADLGFNLKYDICHWLSADVSMLNGEGFRRVQLDNHFLYALGFDLRPIENLDLRVYGDIQTHNTNAVTRTRNSGIDTTVNQVARKNLHFFAGYDHRYFRIAAEYNMRFASDYVKGDNATGLSVYAVGKITPKLNIFCRYDRGVSNDNDLLATAFRYDHDGQNVFAGVDFHVNKMVAVSPAIQYHITPDNTTSLYAYLSCKVNL